MQDIEARLNYLGVHLPTPGAPVASYKPYVIFGNQLIVSGQLPLEHGRVSVTGKLGGGVSIEQGKNAARICTVNLLAQVKHALNGDWSRLESCLRLGVFVSATPEFTDHPEVANGASDLIEKVFGQQGAHARAAVGCSSLPLGSAVEVEGLFLLR